METEACGSSSNWIALAKELLSRRSEASMRESPGSRFDIVVFLQLSFGKHLFVHLGVDLMERTTAVFSEWCVLWARHRDFILNLCLKKI